MKAPTMYLFFLIAVSILGSLCWYMARRSMALCPPLRQSPTWVYGFFALFLILQFGIPLLHRIPALAHRLDALYWLSWGLFSFIATFLPFLVVADLTQWIARRLGAPVAFSTTSFGLASALSLACTLAGLVAVLRPVKLKRVDVPIANLDPALDGLRIVQISDLHLGPMSRYDHVARIVALSNAQKPDVIALTGDIVDSEADGTRAKAALMKDLDARHGVFYVTGNHEYYSGVRPWLRLFRGFGWSILQNKCEVVEHNGQNLAIIGLPDPAGQRRRQGQEPRGDQEQTGGPDLELALAGAPQGGLRILLNHQPLGYAQAERAGIQLQLSGHTHGGQFFPWNLVVQRIFAYPKGLHQHGRLWIYTSQGTGFWGPPNRFGAEPELTLLTLKRQ